MQIERLSGKNIFLALLIPILLCVIWVKSPLQEGLWLDESITAWIVSGTLAEAIYRSTEFQGQSPFYFILLHTWLNGAELSELLLRLPSFILFVFSCACLYGIARHWFSQQTAIVSVIIFCGMDEVLKAAISARPYMLALFGMLAALYFLLKWIQSDRWPHALGYLCALTISYYAHVVFLPTLLLHAVAFFSEVEPRRKATLKKLLIIWCLFGFCTIPYVMQFLSIAGRHDTLYFAVAPTLKIIGLTFLPPYVLVYGIAALLMALIFGVGRGLYIPLSGLFQQQSLFTLIIWYLFPPVLFLTYTLISGHSMFLPRLFFWYLPALAIIFARILTAIKPQAALTPAVVVCVGLIFFREILRQWHQEDWRPIAQYLSKEVDDQPVLLFPGLIEVEQADWQYASRDSIRGRYMRAPFTIYNGPESQLMSLRDREQTARTIKEGIETSLPPYLVAYRIRRDGLDGQKGYVHQALLAALEKQGIHSEAINLSKQKKPTVLLYKLRLPTQTTKTN